MAATRALSPGHMFPSSPAPATDPFAPSAGAAGNPMFASNPFGSSCPEQTRRILDAKSPNRPTSPSLFAHNRQVQQAAAQQQQAQVQQRDRSQLKRRFASFEQMSDDERSVGDEDEGKESQQGQSQRPDRVLLRPKRLRYSGPNALQLQAQDQQQVGAGSDAASASSFGFNTEIASSVSEEVINEEERRVELKRSRKRRLEQLQQQQEPHPQQQQQQSAANELFQPRKRQHLQASPATTMDQQNLNPNFPPPAQQQQQQQQQAQAAAGEQTKFSRAQVKRMLQEALGRYAVEIRAEYDARLTELLRDQFESFTNFYQDYVARQMDHRSFDYVS